MIRTTPNSVAAGCCATFRRRRPNTAATAAISISAIWRARRQIPAIGRANVLVADNVRFDRTSAASITRSARAPPVGRWIGEHQRDEGGTSSSPATLGRALRGSRGPFSGFFGNLNVGYTNLRPCGQRDSRLLSDPDTTRGADDAIVPKVTITGITAPFGDVFRTEPPADAGAPRHPDARRGKHAIRVGVEVRRITKGLALGPPRGYLRLQHPRRFRRRPAVSSDADGRSGQRPTHRIPPIFHAIRDGRVHPGSVDDRPEAEPEPRAAPRLFRHRHRGERPAVVDHPRLGRHVQGTARRSLDRARRPAL